ncbi:MAG: chromosome segregation protein SMC [Acidobacteria bacterium]|nr:chromosome segregation protein SMC [Acidobacteriota bacterium]
MRLQRLEITGFKSFCDRSELSFDRGVTAIVGPNGCGKSNVADAIVWVLGEQSAKSLRGDRMEDVIFGGSDARKPNAAAEVRLMLAGVPVLPDRGTGTTPDLVDDDGRPMVREVEVTRRLYRSGESEYLINGEIVRLRDVHELLMDTGLGAKAYAIIEQGKIGLILSSRPTDRRQLIEEAAGVTKYKARRRAAELKLDASQQNLTRIDDIVFEVEKQRGVLKRQAAKARRHQRLRDQLRQWEKVQLARRQRVLAQAIASAEARIVQIKESEIGASGHLAQLESDLERLRLELVQLESAARTAREAAHAHEVEIGRLEQRIQNDEEQVTALGRRATDIAGEVETLGLRRGPAAQGAALKQQEVERAAQDREAAAATLSAANEAQVAVQGVLEGLEADVEAARSEQFAAASAASALQHAIDNASSARERVSRDIARWTAEASDLDVEAARAKADHDGAATSLASASARLDEVMRARSAREVELTGLRAERERAGQMLREAEQELAGLAARLDSLERFESARTAYGDAARLVLAESAGEVRHLGSVADYLDVKPGFERAVEACLGDTLQFVVVPTHEEAERALHLVSTRGAGRCGFVVVDGAPATDGGRRSAEALPGLTPLDAVVSVSGACAGALRPFVTNGWIAGTFADAVAAARQTAAPVATRDGEVCRGANLVWGGAGQHDQGGILQTKSDIRQTRERLEVERTQVARLDTTLADVDRRATAAAAAIEAMSAEVHVHEKAIVEFGLRVAQASEQAQRVDQKRSVVALDIRRGDEEIAGLDARQVEARQSVVRLADEQRLVDEKLGAAQRRLFDARDESRLRGERVRDAMAEHARLVERAAAVSLEAARLEEACREIEARLVARREEQQQIAGEQDRLRHALSEATRSLDVELAALDAGREAVRSADEAVGLVRQQGEQQESAIREARRTLDAVRSSLSEAEVGRAKAESDLAHLASICAETLQTDLESVIAEVEQLERDGEVSPDWRAIYADEPEDEPAQDTDGIQLPPAGAEAAEVAAVEGSPVVEPAPRALTPEDAITELKRKIDKLGPVNMMAIEQYDELESRHGFLTTQRKDLVDSIASTGEAIKKIDHTTRERFREAFDAINLHFQEMFASLFSGGRAGLTLLDEDDILESGIEIIAQPPGKRLQNVQLLSGGEKALTAISLMFAIFRYKPSPFCVLDEIDAPLDDANTGRFLDMLRAMQADTQFILITHNRKTMEIADRLYGVTMEEPGVSKLISVKLN